MTGRSGPRRWTREREPAWPPPPPMQVRPGASGSFPPGLGWRARLREALGVAIVLGLVALVAMVAIGLALGGRACP